MSKVEIRQKKRIRQLEEALRPFAAVPPEPDYPSAPIYFYVGQDCAGCDVLLRTDDFTRARVALGVMEGVS